MPARDRQAEGCVVGPAWPCSLCRLWARSWLNLGPGRMALCCGRRAAGGREAPFPPHFLQTPACGPHECHLGLFLGCSPPPTGQAETGAASGSRSVPGVPASTVSG